MKSIEKGRGGALPHFLNRKGAEAMKNENVKVKIPMDPTDPSDLLV